MFDYQAGEKYKLTLIIVGFAGAMVGMFFTLLLAPEQAPQHVAKQRPKWADNPDVNGGRTSSQYPAGQPQGASADAQQPYVATSPDAAVSLIEDWLPRAWDFSAQTAGRSQEQAIQYMSADCAQAYRTNIWTPEMANTIAQSGAVSRFEKSSVRVGETRPDGAVVVLVEGKQFLDVPGKGQNVHEVKFEYLVKQTPDNKLQIAGMGEAGKAFGI
jgi:hypothetical protein